MIESCIVLVGMMEIVIFTARSFASGELRSSRREHKKIAESSKGGLKHQRTNRR
jgi:hypothetical protein